MPPKDSKQENQRGGLRRWSRLVRRDSSWLAVSDLQPSICSSREKESQPTNSKNPGNQAATKTYMQSLLAGVYAKRALW